MVKAKKRRVRATAWIHTMDNTEGLRGNRPQVVLTFSRENPFGVPGKDYSSDYPVTSVPLYTRNALADDGKQA